tara:strand:+ start:569 stop:1231 length:663 start_codon:yes stop_codon:yes gene_type:complete
MNKNKYICIALDGAAGSGKSTTATAICHKFNYIHVDTGLHFRSICFYLVKKNISPNSVLEYLKFNPINLRTQLKGSAMFLSIDNYQFKTDQLRNETMNQKVSHYARLPEVRSILLTYQRNLPQIGQKHGFSGIVMDGRDIGSVVLPEANLKFFLHADASVRQTRRNTDGEKDSITKRDILDSTRKIAPLVCPKDAFPIDTGVNSLDDVINIISEQIFKIR